MTTTQKALDEALTLAYRSFGGRWKGKVRAAVLRGKYEHKAGREIQSDGSTICGGIVANGSRSRVRGDATVGLHRA